MQRRAAAIYAAFFVVVAAGAYTMIGVAQEPAISLQNPDHTLATGDQVTIDGRTYDVSVSGGSADLTWTNESARYTETWENDSTVTVDGTEFTVRTRATATPPEVGLVEVQSLGENATTTEVDGTTYVVVEADGERTLIPRDEYLRGEYGPPETRGYRVDETFAYANETVRVASVTNTSVVLAWTAPRENTVEAGEGDNVTLGGTQFKAHFPDQSTLELTTNIDGYQTQVETIDTYHERVNGLWGVSILSGLAALTLMGMAYLPSRY